MKQVEDEIKILAREEYKEELNAIEEKNIRLQAENTTIKQENTTIKQENTSIKQENNAYRTKIEELKKIGNLNSPKAKEIINSLLLL